MNERPIVITVSDKTPTEPYYCYFDFFESLGRFGHEPKVLGYGEPYRGMMSRLKLPLAFMRQIDNRHVIICDCWDLLFLDSPEAIIERFKMFGAPIVVSAERTLFPAKVYGEYPVGSTDSRYLNAGFIVAERLALIDLFERLNIDNQPDDFQQDDGSWVHYSEQELLHYAFTDKPNPIVLDYRSEICQSMFRTLPGEVCLTVDGVVNTLTNSRPMVIHWNGPAKTEAHLLPSEGVKWWRDRK